MSDSPFAFHVQKWCNVIKLARDYAEKVFFADAREMMQYYAGDAPITFQSPDKFSDKQFADGLPDPTFKMNLRKGAELDQLIGGTIQFRCPHRKVTPRDTAPIDRGAFDGLGPEGQIIYETLVRATAVRKANSSVKASYLQTLLNYTPKELGLKESGSRAVQEGLLKGRGVCWTEQYTWPASGAKVFGSFWDSVDNLVVDPDVRTLRDCRWIARRRILPHWQLEQMFGLPYGELLGKGKGQSYYGKASISSASNNEEEKNRQNHYSNDQVEVYEIYSKMGVGDLLRDMGAISDNELTPFLTKIIEQVGPYIRLFVVEGVDYFLNLSPNLYNAKGAEQEIDAAIKTALSWPVPFWVDNEWPVTVLDFHYHPDRPWPVPHLKFAAGELKFINWAASFMANKVRNNCTDYLALSKTMSEENAAKLKSGSDYDILDFDPTGDDIDKMIKWIQNPPMNPDLLRVLDFFIDQFERRTGLTEIMYGMQSRQMRSAQEAALRGDMTRIRPDTLADRVEDWHSSLARKEGLASAFMLSPQDLEPIFGPEWASHWDQFVYQTPIEKTAYEVAITIESSSARKPNLDRDASNATESVQALGPILGPYSMKTGDLKPINNLLSDFATSRELDPARYQLTPPPPMPPPAPPPEGPPPPGDMPPPGPPSQPPQG